jgi:hypothetical protein
MSYSKDIITIQEADPHHKGFIRKYYAWVVIKQILPNRGVPIGDIDKYWHWSQIDYCYKEVETSYNPKDELKGFNSPEEAMNHFKSYLRESTKCYHLAESSL